MSANEKFSTVGYCNVMNVLLVQEEKRYVDRAKGSTGTSTVREE
jgi:hypothetical protein